MSAEMFEVQVKSHMISLWKSLSAESNLISLRPNLCIFPFILAVLKCVAALCVLSASSEELPQQYFSAQCCALEILFCLEDMYV